MTHSIHLVKGCAEGQTELSAFDSALHVIGIMNYNLIVLSSVIPPGCQIVEPATYSTPSSEFGDRLYCVKADIRSSVKGEVIAAALGWYQFDDLSGVFVEHELHGVDAEEVVSQINRTTLQSLEDLCRNRNVQFELGRAHTAIAHCIVGDLPACAIVVAAYKSERWNF